MKFLLFLLGVLNALTLVFGHGYLKDPLNRASLWRKRMPGAPLDFEDNQQFCGGFQRQWKVNRGRCGICGDDYALPRPRPYENTGAKSIGYVVKSYSPGDTIQVTVVVTASHLGHFEFHLCPLTSPDSMEQEKCFVPLPLADGSGFQYHVKTWRVGEYKTKVVLPEGVSCERCVIRWQYTAGNSWGVCSNGTGANGCGPQETFRSCSDVSIVPKSRSAAVSKPAVFLEKLLSPLEKVLENRKPKVKSLPNQR